MFDIGLQEMVVIGVLALLVFGPSKLPELGRTVGRWMRELRRASDEFRSTVETNLEINEPWAGAKPPVLEPDPAPALSEATSPAAGVGDAGSSPDVSVAAGGVTAGEPYVAQRGGRLFHRSDCSWATRIGASERVPLATVIAGREGSFVECPVCQPWEPA